MNTRYPDIPIDQIPSVLVRSHQAFDRYRRSSLAVRASLLRAIASELEDMGDAWLQTAQRETHLPEARLRNERARTIFQLESYALACEHGDWMRISIDTAISERTPPRPDIRKMMVPLGPVVVFGASNFPYAYSTAGGDTASALAAGCTVIIKAHPAHPETSEMAAEAIGRALDKLGLPRDIFQHVHGASFEVGQRLVQERHTAAVGFTGSFSGGKQLFDWANQRAHPIPVFAEMGSVNPIFLLPDHLTAAADTLAETIGTSVTLGVGQFCTNPGLLIGIEAPGLYRFFNKLLDVLRSVPPAPMLHEGIRRAYIQNAATFRARPGVESILPAGDSDRGDATPQLSRVLAERFLSDPHLQSEVFGPATLLVVCRNAEEMQRVAAVLEGQLTCSVFGTPSDFSAFQSLLQLLPLRCGRLNFNSVPTGVEVVQSMHHGGPFPATTDPRFTAVGSDAILRFARPISFQNCPEENLPEELRSENPLKIWRKVNGTWSQGSIG